MSHQSDLIASDIQAYLNQHENKELLRFLTCGSVDDGKVHPDRSTAARLQNDL